MWFRFKVYPTMNKTADKLDLQGDTELFNIPEDDLTSEKLKEVQATLLEKWVRTKGKGIEMKIKGKNPYDLPPERKISALKRTLWSDGWREKIAKQLWLEFPSVRERKVTSRRIYQRFLRVSKLGKHFMQYIARDKKGHFVKFNKSRVRRLFR